MTLTETYTTELFPTADWQAFVKEREAEEGGKDWFPFCSLMPYPNGAEFEPDWSIPSQRVRLQGRMVQIIRGITIEEWWANCVEGRAPLYSYAARFV